MRYVRDYREQGYHTTQSWKNAYYIVLKDIANILCA